MPRTPAAFTEADIRRVIRAAKKELAGSVEIKKSGVTITIVIDGKSVAVDDSSEIVL